MPDPEIVDVVAPLTVTVDLNPKPGKLTFAPPLDTIEPPLRVTGPSEVKVELLVIEPPALTMMGMTGAGRGLLPHVSWRLRSNVPPLLIVSVFAALFASVPDPEILNIPPSIVTPPVNVLALSRFNVPPLDLVSEPVPLMIPPEKV